ncbi:chalcone isomerase family protein [Aquabacterium sp. OR-4]|uniref:chalcone isomerase family protein n=1 Tax=Aquabacterium sp. OR-4 TaxID=2978127 RepID=UPI0021B4B499|nr:chalcone isomerase family protein [Aquabacterium sp. OR-4]MDT7836310.1 chalcone isomerase family protein [Aquabacterium sp. OR-4]
MRTADSRGGQARLTAPGMALLLALLLATGAQAQGTPSTRFDANVTLQGQALLLNGAGTRYKAVFRVYDMGLYTTRRVATPAELLALPGAKRLQFVALRELPGTDLGRLFIKGLSDNARPDEMNRHLPSMTRFIEIFSGRSKLMPGDSFAMDFVPGKGTQFFIAGQPQGTPVGDDEFFRLVLRIWFGERPADHLLRDALLGVAPRVELR